jgi:lipid-A-disaccharide synthase
MNSVPRLFSFAGTRQIMPSVAPVILFTAFEPSGDAHAAPVIASIRLLRPDIRMFAWGGKRMAAAGATLIEESAQDGVMGLTALKRARAVRKQMKAIRAWASKNPIAMHVPVDSPASNLPLSRKLRRNGVKTVHLVAPQLWAWGKRRLRKLRRNTEHLLCLLPFEEEWFRKRRVPATFIGHPVMNRALDLDQLDRDAAILPQGAPKLGIFPGSRMQEIRKNTALLLAVYTDLKTRHSEMCGVVVCARTEIAKAIRKRFPILPTGLHLVTVNPDIAVRWCDCALTVSGTMSLDLARQLKPMIGIYKVGWISRIIAWLVLRTPHRLLPNIIANARIVPEFVPFSGGPGPIVAAATPLLGDSRALAKQSAALEQVRAAFAGHDPAEEGARIILDILGNPALHSSPTRARASVGNRIGSHSQ